MIAAVRNPEAINDLLEKYPSNLLLLKVDVTDRETCFKAVIKAKEHFGKIDTLINNAGYGHFGAIEELTPEEVRGQFETNLFGTLWMTQAILPIFREQQSGHIVMLSSALGLSTLPAFGLYSATKFAVEGLGDTLAQEVKSFGIHITILEPNGFDTDFSGKSLSVSKEMEIYNPVRETIFTLEGARPGDAGKPEATIEAVLKLIDMEIPPLRFILGKAALPWVKHTYEQRLKTWEEWKEISAAAHG